MYIPVSLLHNSDMGLVDELRTLFFLIGTIYQLPATGWQPYL